MARRRKTEYAISLFAFQDIITSVSGVLIMVVLLLALELTQRTISNAAEGSFRATAARIRAEQARISAELGRLETDLASSEKLIRLATANPQGLIADRIQAENSAAEAMKNDLAVLEGAARNLDKAEEQLDEAQDDLQEFDDDRLKIELRIASLKRTLAQMSDPRNVSYSVPTGIEPARAWLCDVAGTPLRLHSMAGGEEGRGQNEIPVSEGQRSEVVALVRNWMRTQNPAPEYILFLVRPPGAWIDRVLHESGERLSIPFGVELIGNDQIVVDGTGRPLQ